MKILLIDALKLHGGQENYIFTLFRTLLRQGVDVHLCVGRGSGFVPKDIQENSSRVHEICISSFWDVRALWGLKAVVSRIRPDLMHANGDRAPLFPVILRMIGAVRKPLVTTAHLHMVDYEKENNFSWVRSFLYRIAFRILEKIPERIIAVSQGVKDKLVKYDAVEAERITVIHNGIEDPIGDRRDECAPVEGPEGPCVIGTIARLDRQKGIRYLLESLQFLKEKMEIKCILVGDGPEREALQSLARELNVSDMVTFAGYQRKPIPYYRMMDIYVMPSLWEGFPLSLIEAMACERAIIASKIPGVVEAIEDGKTGVLVSPRDPEGLAKKIEELVRQAETRTRLARGARRKFETEFTLDKMVEKTVAVYEEAIKSF